MIYEFYISQIYDGSQRYLNILVQIRNGRNMEIKAGMVRRPGRISALFPHTFTQYGGSDDLYKLETQDFTRLLKICS